MYEGYLRFAGTEIANAARTAAYVENIMPRFGFDSCWDSEDLPCVLGDEPYRTPALDPAPWFSPARPESSKFLGFYPLSVIGIEDSSREVNVTELVQDGAVFSMPRRASKEFRVQGVLIAEDGQGLDVGMSWLRGALEGAECLGGDEDLDGDCAGGAFRYLAYLPTCCNYNDESLFPPVPMTWTWTTGVKGPWVNYSSGMVAASTNGTVVTMPCNGDGAQLHIDGLITGEAYRVTVEIGSANRIRLEVGGNDGITAKRTNEHFPGSKNPWVLDFIARGEVQTIRVLNAEEGCTPATARLYAAKVERTAERLSKFLPRFTSESFTEPASWYPVPTAPITDISRSVAISGPTSVEELDIAWANSTGSTKTVPEDAGARRLIRGLTEGQRYIIYIKTFMSNGVGLHFNVAGVPETATRLGNYWYTISFVASAPQQYLEVLVDDPFNVAGGSMEELHIQYLRVDADPQTLEIQPVDQSLPARRALYNVTLIDGPNVIEQFNKDQGAMMSVEFSMAVGEPSIYGPLIDIQPTIEATTFLIGNTRCQQGFPIRYNSFSNPRLAGASVGSLPVLGIGQHTNVSQANATVVVAAANGIVAEQSARITPSGASTNSYMLVGVDETDLDLGHTYTVSATFSQTAVQAGALSSLARSIMVPNGGGEVYSEPADNVTGEQRVHVTFTYLGGTAQIRFYNGSNSAADVVYWSNFLFEETGIVGTPFDGDTDGAGTEYTWTGTIHASTSKFAEDKPKVITDPDCDPVPVAPQPPGIVPDCPRDVEEWRRYWMEIPAEFAGGWRESVPVVKLTTASNAVRDVRLRFFPNPGGASLGEIDPCAALGDFYITYIPPDTVMVVDGVRERVTADVSNRGPANAMHLTSDSNDYGPARWPAMTCDIPYFMTVDIAPDEVLDLDIRLAVAMKE